MKNSSVNAKNFILKGGCYLLGFLLIATGINFTKMTALGISPVSSIPRACQLIWDFTLGTTTFIIYGVLIVLQLLLLFIALKKKNEKVTGKNLIPFAKALLGFPVTFLFSFMIDLTGLDAKAFGHLLLGFPRPENYPMRALYTVIGLILIAAGVFMYLRPRWIPMPAEGLASAMSELFGMKFGDCKTIVDCSMIAIALVLQLIFLGGFSSFTSEAVVVREGTAVAAVAVGQLVKLLTKLFGAKADKLIGIQKKQ